MSEAAPPPPVPIPSPTKSEPQGFRGWLLLLAFGVCLSPLRTLIEFVGEFGSYGRAWTVPNGQTVVLFEIGINLALIVLEVRPALCRHGGHGIAVPAGPERGIRCRGRPYAPDNDRSRAVGLVPAGLGAGEEHLHELRDQR